MNKLQHELSKAPKRGARSLDEWWFESEMASIQREKIMKINGKGAEERFCDCAELVINGKRYPSPRFHNCWWVAEKNKLIPQAEKLATERVGQPPKDADGYNNYGYRWTKIFVYELDRLAAPLLK
jgi:hypothetical protein